MQRRHGRVGRKLRSFPKRVARFVRALFGGGSNRDGWSELDGGVGVREPRRPLTPSLSGATAVDLPEDDRDET